MENDWGLILIRTDRPATAEMLSHWEWLIGTDKRPLVMSKFGDWFLGDPEGRVHWLGLLEGNCDNPAGDGGQRHHRRSDDFRG